MRRNSRYTCAILTIESYSKINIFMVYAALCGNRIAHSVTHFWHPVIVLVSEFITGMHSDPLNIIECKFMIRIQVPRRTGEKKVQLWGSDKIHTFLYSEYFWWGVTFSSSTKLSSPIKPCIKHTNHPQTCSFTIEVSEKSELMTEWDKRIINEKKRRWLI